jgi:hypothetical protein
MMKNNISLRWYNYSSNKTREWNQLKYTYNTCALSKHIGHMCMRPKTEQKRLIMCNCIYPAMRAFTDQYSPPNICFDISLWTMIKVFEIILCMYLKTISPDVPRFTFVCSIYNRLISCYFSSFESHPFIFQNSVCFIILIVHCFNFLGNIDITWDKIGQQ